MYRNLGVALAAILCFQTTSALTCQGAPIAPAIEATSGDVLVSNIGGLIWPRLCNIRTTSPQGIAPETCKGIYATLLTAQAQNRAVTISTTSSTYSSCSAVPQWQYLEGFYWIVING